MNKYANRLLKLAEYLETKVPRKQFDITTYVDDFEKSDLSCGTKACALGWAATMPCFKRLGLRLVKNDADGSANIQTHNYYGIDVASELFGLSSDQADRLFMSGAWSNRSLLTDKATPKQVAKEIRKFVKEKYPCNA